jgi:hypothetical protein
LRHDIVRAVVRRNPAIDFPTVLALGLTGTPDDELLALAAEQNRIVVSHDVSTMTAAARERVENGIGISGLLIVPQSAEWRPVIECLLLVAEDSDAEDWLNVIEYLPW